MDGQGHRCPACGANWPMLTPPPAARRCGRCRTPLGGSPPVRPDPPAAEEDRAATRPSGRVFVLGAAVLGAVMLGGIVVTALREGRTDRPPAPQADASALPVPARASRLPPTYTGPVDTVVFGSTDSVLTRMTRGTSDPPTLVSESRTLDVLAGGQPPIRLLARGAHLVVWGRTSEGGFATFVVDARDPRSPELLGEAQYFLPSADPDGIWLVHDRGAPDRPAVVSEADIATLSTGPERTAPVAGVARAGLRDGIVLEQGDALVAWFPAEDTVVPLPGIRVLAAAVRTAVTCDEPCRTVTIADVVTGDVATLDTPDGTSAISGSLSPDGSRLALSLSSRSATSIAVVDEDGALRPVRGGEHDDGSPHLLTWAPSGNWLFFDGARNRILAWRAETGDTQMLSAVPYRYRALAAATAPPTS